jgi:hypothetical protein
MIRRILAALILAGAAGVVISSLPDITRYLKIREM